MKTLPAGLQAHLDSGATTLCWCWRIARRDGVVQGFTDHDTPLIFSGTTYEAVSGFTASEIQSSLGLSVDNLALLGALSSASLNEHDLAAGLYDDAQMEIWRVNWTDTAQRLLMRKGNLGEVKRGKTAFEVELRGLAHRLNQTVGRAFGYACDADVGDARCTVGLNSATYKGTGAVAAVTDSRRFTTAGLSAYAHDWFSSGKLTFTSGANNGLAMEVKRHSVTAFAVSIELWQPMPETLAPGNSFTITAGCDKTFATCKAKFANGANFRGHPYMPGNDAVISYANTGEALDGASRYGN